MTVPKADWWLNRVPPEHAEAALAAIVEAGGWGWRDARDPGLTLASVNLAECFSGEFLSERVPADEAMSRVEEADYRFGDGWAC